MLERSSSLWYSIKLHSRFVTSQFLQQETIAEGIIKVSFVIMRVFLSLRAELWNASIVTRRVQI